MYVVYDGISVEFMRKNKLTPHTFVAAASENISSVEESGIIQAFRPPKIDRRGGFRGVRRIFAKGGQF